MLAPSLLLKSLMSNMEDTKIDYNWGAGKGCPEGQGHIED